MLLSRLTFVVDIYGKIPSILSDQVKNTRNYLFKTTKNLGDQRLVGSYTYFSQVGSFAAFNISIAVS